MPCITVATVSSSAGTTPGRGANAGAPPFVSLNREGTVSHERRGEAMEEDTEGLISPRTRECT